MTTQNNHAVDANPIEMIRNILGEHAIDKQSFDNASKYVEECIMVPNKKPKVSMRELERRIMRVSDVRHTQFQTANSADGVDAYNMGLYNGLEIAASILYDRKARLMKAEPTNKVEHVEGEGIPVEDDEHVTLNCSECGQELSRSKDELMEDEYGPVESIICKDCCSKTTD